jgi:hypothetical protein
MKHKNEKNQ